MTIPGLPVIYYGDEIGIPGGNDPDSRRMMKFGDLTPLESETRANAIKLANLRKNNLALIYGNYAVLQVTEKTYVFARQYFNHAAIVFFNKSDQPVQIKIDVPSWLDPSKMKAEFGRNFSIVGSTLNMELSPWSFEILTQKL
jgi:glycosidase